MGRTTPAPIEETRNELAKIESYIKTTHTAFPKGAKFGYVAAIMTAVEYRKRVYALDSAWTFTKPTKTSTYYPSIKILTAEFKKIINRRHQNYHRINMKFISESKVCGRRKSSKPTTGCGSRKWRTKCSTFPTIR